MMKTIVLFDLDDTLFCRDDYIKKTYIYICQSLSLDDEISDYMFSSYLESGENNVFQKTIEKFKLEKNVLKDMIEKYQNSKVNIELYDDAKRFIFDNKNNYRFGIVTNGGLKTQKNKIRLLNLDHEIEKIVITGERFRREDWKPSKCPFDYILHEMNVEPYQCIYIGDKFEIDVIGAMNANILPVLIKRDNASSIIEKKYDKKDYYEINSFDCITNLIKIIDKR